MRLIGLIIFEGTHTPLIRMRSRLRGPEHERGDRFSRLLTDQEFRVQWDPNCAEIYEMYLPDDISDIELVMEGKFGECRKFGLGYCRTKQVSFFFGAGRPSYSECGFLYWLAFYPTAKPNGISSTHSK